MLKRRLSIAIAFVMALGFIGLCNVSVSFGEGTNIITNPGFEGTGTGSVSGWTGVQGDGRTTNKVSITLGSGSGGFKTGAYSLKIGNRTNNDDAAKYDLLSALQTGGQGTYNISFYTKSGYNPSGTSTTPMMTITLTDSNGTRTYPVSGTALSQSWTLISGTAVLNWTTLTAATVAFTVNEFVGSMYVDDISMVNADAATPDPGATATPTPAPTLTPIPTATSTPTPTPDPNATPTPTPDPNATPTPTPIPTATPSPTPTPAPTAVPTSTPAPSPTATSTPSPTPVTGLNTVAVTRISNAQTIKIYSMDITKTDGTVQTVQAQAASVTKVGPTDYLATYLATGGTSPNTFVSLKYDGVSTSYVPCGLQFNNLPDATKITLKITDAYLSAPKVTSLYMNINGTSYNVNYTTITSSTDFIYVQLNVNMAGGRDPVPGIRIENTGGSTGLKVDYITAYGADGIPQKLEAESGSLLNGAVSANVPNASGGSCADISATGKAVKFSNLSQIVKISLRIADASASSPPQQLKITVDGTTYKTISYTPTGLADNYFNINDIYVTDVELVGSIECVNDSGNHITSIPESGGVTVKATIMNNKSTGISPLLVAVLYNSDNEIIGMETGTALITNGQSAQLEAVITGFPENRQGCCIKAYIIDSMVGLKPLTFTNFRFPLA